MHPGDHLQNTVSGISSCALMLVFGVLVITNDCLGVICLLKGYAGPGPDIL